MISRVFQKSNTGHGGTTVSATASSSKKTKMTSTTSASNSMSLCPEPSSPSSVYLPPLLDSSPYTTTAFNDRYNNNNNNNTTPREHVSCFSTTTSANVVSSNNNNFNNASFDFAPPQPPLLTMDPFARFQRNAGVSAFPCLRSLQDNLQLPLFFSSAAQPFHGGSGEVLGSWPMPEEQRVADGGTSMAGLGSTELDCMWNY